MIVHGILCPMCGDEVWSRHRHDLRWCKCHYCFIDGGRAYQRWGYGGPDFEEPWIVPSTIEIEVSDGPSKS